MRLWSRILPALLLALAPLLPAPEAAAGPPTEYIRARIDRVYALLGATKEPSAADRRAANAILDEMFDWEEMSRRALGSHWDARTAAERAEFTRLFAGLFGKTYVSRIRITDRETFQYLDEVVDGDSALVRTKVITRKARREIPVDYQTRRSAGDRWKIHDLEVQGLSLVDNYRSQFAALIARASYEDLVGKLRAIVGKEPEASRGGVVLVGAGDIASCVSEGDEATAALLDGIDGTVITMGDNAYEAGTSIEFAACYEPSWGRHRARTRPSPGNHDYGMPGAPGYFEYFGAAAGEPDRGYYSYRAGDWHVLALNSNCRHIGGCEAGSPQERWLRADLAANPTVCTLAYWHHPRFSSGPHGSDEDLRALWQALYDHGAEVVLSGHDHVYERFAPQDANGRLDPARGIRQFVVGTGGASLDRFKGPAAANSEVRNDDALGLLRLTLHAAGYDWEFVPVAGRTFRDAGSGSCR